MQPRVVARSDVREDRPRRDGTDREESEADDDPRDALGGHVQHRHEQAKEEQRGAEVPLSHLYQQGCGPHDEQRAEVAGPWQADAKHLGASERERIAVGHQVAGEEDDECDLGKLARLQRSSKKRDPDPGAVDLSAHTGNQRKHQAKKAEHPRRIGVATQHAMVFEQADDEHRSHNPHNGPDFLSRAEVRDPAAGGVGKVDAADDREAKARDREGRG